MDNPTPGSKNRIIKSLYFYVVSFVALMMVVWSGADMINIALKTWVFTKADRDFYYPVPACSERGIPEGVKADPATPASLSKEECEKQNQVNIKQAEENRIAQRQMNLVRDISMIVVGIPLFWVHWRILRRKDEDL